jgi:peptidyl-prolyl cis-trans isomerase SurA|tara:strand:- start:11458 stop:12387 length:930 start_codon:yes stop_codon:yes gene_type:complete
MKKFLSILIFFNFFFIWCAYSNEIYVVLKVNNNVITNYDIDNEYRYLIALSPSLQNVNKETVMKLAKDSIIREKIKEAELNRHFNLNIKNKFIDKIISVFYKKMGMKNINEFKNYLSKYNLNFEEIEKKISIEAAWNDLIYKKFANRIEINELEVKKEIKKNILDRKEQSIYFISEILFVADNYEKLKKEYKIIEKSILEIGFNNTANIYSVSDSAKLGGEVGWISESQLNETVKKEIINLKIGNHSKPITVPGGFLIIKINDKKMEMINLNYDMEFKKKIENEKNSQLKNFSEIYFKKIKKNSTISEK